MENNIVTLAKTTKYLLTEVKELKQLVLALAESYNEVLDKLEHVKVMETKHGNFLIYKENNEKTRI